MGNQRADIFSFSWKIGSTTMEEGRSEWLLVGQAICLPRFHSSDRLSPPGKEENRQHSLHCHFCYILTLLIILLLNKTSFKLSSTSNNMLTSSPYVDVSFSHFVCPMFILYLDSSGWACGSRSLKFFCVDNSLYPLKVSITSCKIIASYVLPFHILKILLHFLLALKVVVKKNLIII